MNLYLPVVLMVVGTTLYHLAQKSVPSQVNPLFSLVMNYLSALVGTLVLVPVFPAWTADAWSWRSINWASCAVGAAIVVSSYRYCWRIERAGKSACCL